MFAHSSGEDDGVYPTHGSCISTDVFLDAIVVHVECQLSALVAFFHAVFHVAHVAAQTRDAEKTRFLIEQILHLIGGLAFFLHDGEHHRSIEVACACAHHKSFERGESHGGVDALAVVYCRNGSSVADVAGDDFLIFRLSTQHFAHALGDEAVTGAVSTPTTDVHFLVVVVRHGIHIGVSWHRLVERSVEHKDVGHVFYHSFHRVVTFEGRWVVEGRKVHVGFPLFEHFVSDKTAFCEASACDDTVTSGCDFVQTLDGAILGVHQGVEHHFDAFSV